MRRLLVILLLAGAGVFLPAPAHACTCGRSSMSAEETLRSAEIVVAGEITKPLVGPYWEMSVDRVARGSVGPWLILRGEGGASQCGFGVGRTPQGRFVYAGGRDGQVLGCGNNLFPETVLAEHGLTTYAAATDIPPRQRPLAPVVLALALLGAFGVAYVRSRRPLPMPVR